MKKTALFSTLILMIGILNEGCKNDNFVPIFGECPVVTITSPTNASTSVPLDKIIRATFNETMDGSSFTTTSFTLMNNIISVPGTVSYQGLMATFKPASPLLPNTTYHARIKKTVKDLLGTYLQADYDWTFSTGTTLSFQIIETDPLNLATDVVLNKTITATFNFPIDSASMNSSNFILTQGATVIAGTVLCDGVIANFKPNNPLIPNTLYTVTITTDVKDKLGAGIISNYVWTFTTIGGALPFVDLKTVDRFGIISGVGVSNNAGASIIRNLDVGIYPGTRSSITGFPPATIVNGQMYAADDGGAVAAMLQQAKLDLVAAYLFAEGASSPAHQTVAGNQGGKTLAPGIYKSTSTLSIDGSDLTLDAQGNPDAFWIFQIASSFTTTTGGNVKLIGGAQAKNVFWQTGSSATIGTYTTFNGNILALQSITMSPYATAFGRMLARNGAVVMTSTNSISKP